MLADLANHTVAGSLVHMEVEQWRHGRPSRLGWRPNLIRGAVSWARRVGYRDSQSPTNQGCRFCPLFGGVFGCGGLTVRLVLHRLVAEQRISLLLLLIG